MRHACLRAPCVAWPLLSPTFALSLFLSFFFSVLINYCFNPENELEHSFKVNKHVNYAKPPSVKPSGSQSSRKIEIKITIQIRKVGLSKKRKVYKMTDNIFFFIIWYLVLVLCYFEVLLYS